MLEKPEDILNQWIQAINQGDIQCLLGLYHDTAVLIPTFSNRLLSKPARLREYFELLGSREQLHISLHEKTLIVQPLTQSLYALCGIYCWRFAIEGELLNFEARFSYVVDLALDKPILHHHSSQIPRML